MLFLYIYYLLGEWIVFFFLRKSKSVIYWKGLWKMGDGIIEPQSHMAVLY